MSTATAANLMGITGIARRLVMDGALDEAVARKAMDAATAEKTPLAMYLVQHRLATPAALAAANSVEFGMPIVDALAIDPAQSAITLVRKSCCASIRSCHCSSVATAYLWAPQTPPTIRPWKNSNSTPIWR